MLVVRAHAGGQAIRREGSRIVDDKIRRAEAREFLACRADEHRVHEERVIWPRADDADLDAILRIPSRETVETVEPLARVEVIERALAVDFKRVLVERDVHRPPPDILLRRGILDHALVLRRPASLHAGVGDKGAVLGDARVFLETNRMLVECARRKVVIHFCDGETMLAEVESGRCCAVHRYWI